MSSSPFQPLIDFTRWCETETSNLFAPLPPKGQESRLANIARRIVFICSLILPLIGLISVVISEGCKQLAPTQIKNTPPPPKLKPTGAKSQSAPPSQKEKAGISSQKLKDTVFLLTTISPKDLTNPEVLNNYLDLKSIIEKIDPKKLNPQLKPTYDQAIQRIKLLDPAINSL